MVGIKKYTPLHYAAKFPYLKIRHLPNFKTPSDICVDKDITRLFDLMSDSFDKVNEYNIEVIHELNKIKEIDTVL